ncbi:MAG: hypothetical protein DRQ37_05860 [Gammaproteobacteria bacterium]|nr:MAG: hypothetical protein DRQ37_05860 [Gammaproteobacteria bacterium]
MPLNELKIVSAIIAVFVVVACGLIFIAELETWLSLLIAFGVVIVVPGAILIIVIMKMNKDEDEREKQEGSGNQ